MNYKIQSGVLRFDILRDYSNIVAGFSTNIFGNLGIKNNSPVQKISNRKNFFFNAELKYDQALFQNQQHTKNIKIINKHTQKEIQDNDGMITAKKGLILTVLGADCTPVYLFDENQTTIALIHVGRIGLKKGIVTECLNIFKEKFSIRRKEIISILGPSICEKCYKINQTIATDYQAADICIRDNFPFLNLKSAIKRELKDIKLIEDIKICTKDDTRFFSYRREGKNHGTGMGFMYLKE